MSGQECAECKRLKALVSDLLREAADTARAAQAEEGISDVRRFYRVDLERRLREAREALK